MTSTVASSRCGPAAPVMTAAVTGLQIVGRTYRDADVFRAGLAFEEVVGGWYGNAASRPRL
jgi:amidase